MEFRSRRLADARASEKAFSPSKKPYPEHYGNHLASRMLYWMSHASLRYSYVRKTKK